MNLIPECIELMAHAVDRETEALAHFFALLCIIGGIAFAIVSERCFSHHHGPHGGSGGAPSKDPSQTPSDGDKAEPQATGGDTAGDRAEVNSVGMYCCCYSISEREFRH